MTSVLFTYPLELVRVRMAYATRSSSSTPHRPSFIYAMSRIYNEGPSKLSSASTNTESIFSRVPILKFYRGFTVTITGMIPYAGTSFLAWGFLRSHFVPTPSPTSPSPTHAKPTPIADLMIGAISGALAQTVSYPFEVVRRRMQIGGLTQPDRWLRWGETVSKIYAADGLRGFYVGLSIGYLKVVPMTAVSYAVWQWARRVLDL